MCGFSAPQPTIVHYPKPTHRVTHLTNILLGLGHICFQEERLNKYTSPDNTTISDLLFLISNLASLFISFLTQSNTTECIICNKSLHTDTQRQTNSQIRYNVRGGTLLYKLHGYVLPRYIFPLTFQLPFLNGYNHLDMTNNPDRCFSAEANLLAIGYVIRKLCTK